MMGANQDEHYQYFYLDKKLVSNVQSEMAEALCTLHTFLPKVKKIELVNSIMVRLMDFLENCRYFYIKELSRRVIESNASIILNIPSREQMQAVLFRCLKGIDQYTRIICLQIISVLPQLFVKDIAIYHQLLNILSKRVKISFMQRKQTVNCLVAVLRCSIFLSSLLAQNVHIVFEEYTISLNVLVFLLENSCVPPSKMEDLFDRLTELLGRLQNPAYRKCKKRLIRYYSQCALQNYKLAEKSEKYLCVLPSLAKIVHIIKQPYLFEPITQVYQDDQTLCIESRQLTIAELLDTLYIRKKEHKTCHQFHNQVHKLLEQFIMKQWLNPQTQFCLLFFYCDIPVKNIYDYELASKIRSSSIPISRTVLKMLIVGQAYHSCLAALDNAASNHPEADLIMRVYLDFVMKQSKQDKTQALITMQQICSVLQTQLAQLIQLWLDLNQLLEMQHNEMLIFKINDTLENFKSNDMFEQEIQVIWTIIRCICRTNDISQQIPQAKILCVTLPISCLQETHYWYVYLHKTAVLALYR